MLTSAERKALQAKAHKLEPVVQISANGLTEQAHELINVRAGSLEREARKAAGGEVCVLYRKKPDD